MRVTFQEIKVTGVRTEIVGGKKRRRQKTFWQTVSPFNRQPDGRVKSPAEVRVDVYAEAAAWERGEAST